VVYELVAGTTTRTSLTGFGLVILVSALVVVSAGMALAAPALTRVERTGDGYALIGQGFGTDVRKVEVYEGACRTRPCRPRAWR